MQTRPTPVDLGLLVLRLFAGGTMAVSHGWGKLLGFAEHSATFPDPFGMGSPVSMGLAVFAEVVCAALLVAGAFTRLAAVPLVITMVTAGFIVHGADPFAKKELAFAYLAMYLTLLGTGAGALSVDARFRGKGRR
ncbi:MAG: DoxX family protein [Pseudomonadota bacterium]|nr:DoxX family protein [Pseudomonadota bacterium]